MSNTRRAMVTTGPGERPELLDELVRYEFPPQAPAVGSDAEVWRATDLLTGEDVAIKMMHVDRIGDADLWQRLRNEALIGARLGALHANIVTVRDLGVLADRLYVVADWVEGGSVRSRCGRLSIQECVTIIAQCGSALRTVHGEGVLHTDICPDNVLYVTEERRALLADFGLATARDGHAEWLGRTGPVLRRSAYLPPPGHPAHPPPLRPAVDTFALAMTFRALLTGRDGPFGDMEDEMVVARTGHPAPGALANLIRRYTIAATSSDDARQFVRDLWRATG